MTINTENDWNVDTTDNRTVRVSKKHATISVTVLSGTTEPKLRDFNTIEEYLVEQFGYSSFTTDKQW